MEGGFTSPNQSGLWSLPIRSGKWLKCFFCDVICLFSFLFLRLSFVFFLDMKTSLWRDWPVSHPPTS